MIENVVLSNLLFNEEYTRHVIPYIKDEYFSDPSDKIIFKSIKHHLDKYNTMASKDVLVLALDDLSDINDEVYESTASQIAKLEYTQNDLEWLVDESQKFVRERAYYLALQAGVAAVGDSTARGKAMQMMSDALAISFDSHIGHDYMAQAEDRFNYYNKKEFKVPITAPHVMKEITKGGFSVKTLNVFMAGVHVGKSLWLCHLAAENLRDGKNVLYLTLEMAEEEIARRIDTNLLNVTFNELEGLTQDEYLAKFNRLRNKANGRLIIKEYPSGSVNANHIRSLLAELKGKQKFVPDIVYIDYLNLCASFRVKDKGNSYDYIKNVAEELRGLAQENNFPIVSATQVNRTGFSSTDPEMDMTSESFGLPMTVDFMLALTQPDEMKDLDQYACKQLKNRYNGTKFKTRFVVGVNVNKQQLYDVEDEAQTLQGAGDKEMPPFIDRTDASKKVKNLF